MVWRMLAYSLRAMYTPASTSASQPAARFAAALSSAHSFHAMPSARGTSGAAIMK